MKIMPCRAAAAIMHAIARKAADLACVPGQPPNGSGAASTKLDLACV